MDWRTLFHFGFRPNPPQQYQSQNRISIVGVIGISH